nr:immunoglobulin light chain junction region [Macaca mulatta]MOW09057.1 immunoglobulin light chain junction region [Macaca mulatta]MOW10212.1 immunoglobulin light chain junction region [Macaca mulatta]MOW10527.1 immunoglobulin light chain junction region [Macaca mulatta]MOW12148.1 immunoglobulin light chain junction region [Macaca mulatta]
CQQYYNWPLYTF